ncbi:MAG: hypothetical protein H0X24_03490 [Ktedonobacterales bacterium]|nr:hypothetical protein [Ktedonobacterales bacterium]
MLLHPRVEVAVLETAREGILREGLAFDACTVGVVTNISADHLGQGGITSLNDLARVKQVVIEAVPTTGTAVLNAEDPLVAEMAARRRGASSISAPTPITTALPRIATVAASASWWKMTGWRCARAGSAFR